MGADLYIKINGKYYRDSYNDSNLLWKFGLDCWVYFNKLLNKQGNLTPAKAKQLLQDLKDKKDIFNSNLLAESAENQKYFK